MRKVAALLSIGLVVGLVLAPSNANAIFGLSQCEKVKKEISSLEKITLQYLKRVLGSYYTNPVQYPSLSFIDGEKFFVLTDDAVKAIDSLSKLDPIPKIWKISYNNQKCFTNTQKLRITELRGFSSIDFASYRDETKYQRSMDCQGAGAYVKPDKVKDERCFISKVKRLVNYAQYQSIYKF